MSLDPAMIRRIARLARIGITEADLLRLQTELNGILDRIEQLQAVDISDVAPLTGGADLALRLRDDRITEGGVPDAVLGNAPGRAGPFYAVPKVVE